MILSMVVFNSGTLSLWDCGSQPPWTPPSLLFKHPSQREKKKIYFCFLKKDFNIDAFTSTLQPYLFSFHFILFVICNYCMSIYIFFLPYCYYYIIIFYWYIKCIYVSWPWVTPLLSWARSTLKELSEGLVCDKPSKNKSTEWPNVI